VLIINIFTIFFVLTFSSVSLSAEKTASFRDTISGIEFVFVNGGCFEMGDTFGDGYEDEKPEHQVCVSSFYMGRNVVTVGQWTALMGKPPEGIIVGCGENCPVHNVSWKDAQDFIDKLRSKTNKNYRLPTEAEWEFAAKSGGREEKWAGIGSEDITEISTAYGNKRKPRIPNVGQNKPNGLGLNDMSGTIWQWVQDWYDKNYYTKSPKDNPPGPETGQDRVRRGGSWTNSPQYTRTTIRLASSPDTRGDTTGFRIVLPAQ
jgi:sulfatase modifying factor 1